MTALAQDYRSHVSSELAVAKEFVERNGLQEPKMQTYFKGDVPDLKEHWQFEIINEGVQRFSRSLPRELWLTARSYSDGDNAKYRSVIAAISCGMGRYYATPSEKRMEDLRSALERLNECVRLIDTPVPKWWQRLMWWRDVR